MWKPASAAALLRKTLRGPGVVHSALFGAAAGVAFWTVLVAKRTVKLALFDDETVPRESRERYAEKQQLFAERLAQEQSAAVLATLRSEFDPVYMHPPLTPFSEVAATAANV